MVAPSSTTASSNVMAIGKNKDSSGVFFDKNGNPIVEGNKKFSAPTVDLLGAIKIAFDKFKTYPSYRVLNDSVCILKSEFSTGKVGTIVNGVNHKGEKEYTYATYDFLDKDGDGPFIRIRLASTASSYEWRLPIKDITASIQSSEASFIARMEKARDEELETISQQKKDIRAKRSSEVADIVKLLGITEDEAAAYLAAGHTVDEAAKKVSDWNLASPSSRKAMIAQDALNSETANSSSEFVQAKAGETIKYLAEPVDDMFKGIRNKYAERRATKAYISLVKESSENIVASSRSSSSTQTLLKFEKFYMQSVSEVDSEKYQIVETFNKPKIYFFDRRARVYNYSFVVENTGNISTIITNARIQSQQGGNLWRDEFKNVYEQYLRGTKSVEQRVKAVIHYDGVTRIGYILSCAMSMDSSNDNLAQMQITMFVESEQQRDVEIQVNEDFDSSAPIRQLNAQDLYNKKTVTHIEGSFMSQNPSITDITVPSNIENINSPGRQTFPVGRYVELFLKELPETGENIASAEKSSGSATVDGMTWIATLASTRMESVNYPIDGLFLSDSPDAKSIQSFSEGSDIPITNSGKKVYVVIDTKSKMIQEIAAKQGKDNAKIDYTFLLTSSDKKEFRIRGSATIKPQVLIPSVLSPGNLAAQEKTENNTTYIELSNEKMTFSFDNDTNLKKIFKGSFELQLADKATNTIVALPEANSVDIPTFDSFVGSSGNSDKSLISGAVVLTKKNINTLTCELTLSLDVNDQIIAMTAESCIAKFNIKIGGFPVPVVLKFKREKDTKPYKLLAVHTLRSVNKPDSYDFNYDNSAAVSTIVTAFFDKDPGISISRDIKYTPERGSMTDPNGKSSGRVEFDYKAEYKNHGDVFYGDTIEGANERMMNVNSTVVTNTAVKISKAEAKNQYGVIVSQDFVWTVSMNISYVDSQSIRSTLRNASETNGITKTTSYTSGRSRKVVTKNNGRGAIVSFMASGKVSIANTNMSSDITSKWVNANEEFTSL